MPVKNMEFVRRVLQAFNPFDGADRDQLWWRVDNEYAPVTFFANCNDLFYWGCADGEEITPKNVEILEKATADCRAIDPVCGSIEAVSLFCCRVRKMRPQGACYKHIDQKYWPLFDACGPVRETDMANPRKQPEPTTV